MSNPIDNPFDKIPDTADRPMADAPKSEQSPNRAASSDMTRRKPKRSLQLYLVPVVLVLVVAMLFWPTEKKRPTVAKADQQSVAAANGQDVLRAAQDAQSTSEGKAKQAAAQAAAAANGGLPNGKVDPNAAAAAAIGTGNYAQAADGNPNGNASRPNAQQQQNQQEANAQQAALDKAEQKRAEIASSEILANNVETLRTNGTGGGLATSSQRETPDQLRARLLGDLASQQQQQASTLDKAMQLAATAGGGQGGGATQIVVGAAAQQDKWLASQGGDGDQVLKQHARPEGYVISEGTPIRTVLITGLNTDTPGTVTAQVTSDVYDSATGNALLIPRGSRVIGSYDHNVKNGQDRVLVALTRLVRPDGTWVDLASSSAAEMNGQAGLEGDVDNHFWKIFGSSLVIGAATLLLDKSQTTTTVSQGLGTTQMGGTIFAQTLQDVLNTLLSRNKDIPPTISRDAGTEFIFMVRHDMSLTPYHRSTGVQS
ncbi:TrbI/VirB10 family protein [Paraburkholderia sp. SIMBA_054]|uniref:TrbI/VirB10 family protein n=1 Tax=Paraburkholderia sp. SIMBA_054 TaxID=3085795 RepID=UPI003978672B